MPMDNTPARGRLEEAAPTRCRASRTKVTWHIVAGCFQCTTSMQEDIKTRRGAARSLSMSTTFFRSSTVPCKATVGHNHLATYKRLSCTVRQARSSRHTETKTGTMHDNMTTEIGLGVWETKDGVVHRRCSAVGAATVSGEWTCPRHALAPMAPSFSSLHASLRFLDALGRSIWTFRSVSATRARQHTESAVSEERCTTLKNVRSFLRPQNAGDLTRRRVYSC